MEKLKSENTPLRMLLIGLFVVAFVFTLTPGGVLAQDAKAKSESDMGVVGAKLANPLSSLWSLSMNFELPKVYDGNVNLNNPKYGADMIFQPVLPFPLYGEGDSELRMITRPVIPIIFRQPIPTDFNKYEHKAGIGDMQLPLLFNLPGSIAGNWIIGGGPVGMLPTATNDDLGNDQWALGPAVVFGYKTKKFTAALFPNYFWKVGSSGQDDDTPNINQGSLLYALILNLPNAWQAGFNPTISYNHQATSGNRWNVPVGCFVGKTTKIGKTPVNIKAGLEYSVVSEDFYGKRVAFRLQITPVMPGLVQNPIFGK